MMSEVGFNQHAWKACIVETLSRVRIPLSPPKNEYLLLKKLKYTL